MSLAFLDGFKYLKTQKMIIYYYDYCFNFEYVRYEPRYAFPGLGSSNITR